MWDKKFIYNFKDQKRTREEKKGVGFTGFFYVKTHKRVKHIRDTAARAFETGYGTEQTWNRKAGQAS